MVLAPSEPRLEGTSRARDWTPEEDAEILSLVRQYGQKWTKIAEHLVGRSDSSVRNRYHRLTTPEEPKPERNRSLELPWTPDDDEKLQRGVAKHGSKWQQIIRECARSSRRPTNFAASRYRS